MISADSARDPALASRLWMGSPGMNRGIAQSMVTARKNVIEYINIFLPKYRFKLTPS